MLLLLFGDALSEPDRLDEGCNGLLSFRLSGKSGKCCFAAGFFVSCKRHHEDLKRCSCAVRRQITAWPPVCT